MPEVLREHTSAAIRSIDEYLGPSSQRFFGSGYKRSTYHIQPHMDDDKLSASVDVSYPTDWSLKGKESDLRPHLSTVDVMILGVRSTETLLRNVLGLTPNQVELATMQKLVIRAGTRPEESLEGLQLSAEIKNTDTTSNSDGQTTDSTVVVQVGVMRATVTVRHEAPRAKRLDPPDYSYLIEDSDRYWGAGYRHRDQLIENVVADTETLSAEAEVNVVSTLGDLSKTKGSHSQQFVTFIDVFVSLLQLGQVLMYELDGISRDKSETLWMQRLVLRPSSDHEGCNSVVDRAMATLRITDHQLLTLPNGKWRNVDFAGDSGGIDLSATFAHRVA